MISKSQLVSVIENGLFVLILGLLLFSIGGFIPNPLYQNMVIVNGSMSPTIHVGDMVVLRPPTDEIKTGTIVAITNQNCDESRTVCTVVHRYIGSDENGVPITKGDANELGDDWSQSNVKITGVVIGRVPLVGRLYLAVQSVLRGIF